MVDEPESVILRLLREIRAKQGEHDERFERLEQRMGEVHDTVYAAAGMAMHANVRHDNVAEELAELRQRIEKLEEKV